MQLTQGKTRVVARPATRRERRVDTPLKSSADSLSRFIASASCLTSVDTVNYFAGGSAASFWKAGSERNGSQIGSSLRRAGVIGVGR
jgi:hypothetical protein